MEFAGLVYKVSGPKYGKPEIRQLPKLPKGRTMNQENTTFSISPSSGASTRLLLTQNLFSEVQKDQVRFHRLSQIFSPQTLFCTKASLFRSPQIVFSPSCLPCAVVQLSAALAEQKLHLFFNKRPHRRRSLIKAASLSS